MTESKDARLEIRLSKRQKQLLKDRAGDDTVSEYILRALGLELETANLRTPFT